MSVFNHAEFDRHEAIHFFDDPLIGLNAIIAVHSSMVNGDRGPLVIIRPGGTAGEPMDDGDMRVITPNVETSGTPGR